MTEKTREQQRAEDKPFVESIEAAKTLHYLGDMETLERMLKYAAGELVEQMQEVVSDTHRKIRMRKLAKGCARILLGMDKLYPPVRRWNEAGGIDEFCAKWLGLAETQPLERMEHAVVKFFGEILSVAQYASTPGILEEQYLFQLDAIVERYTKLFIGISPPQQLIEQA